MHSIVHTRACCKALYTMIALCRRRLQYGRRRLLQVGPTRAKLREHAIVSISRVDERHMYVSRHFYRSEGTIAISYFLAPRQYFSTLVAEKIVRGTRCERIMGWQHRTASSSSQRGAESERPILEHVRALLHGDSHGLCQRHAFQPDFTRYKV